MCKKYQSYIDLKVIGGENHGERFSVVDDQLIKPEDIDGENVIGCNVQLDTGVFQLVPFKTPVNGKKRNTYYITGESGCGKSTFAARIAREYKLVNPYNKLVWITTMPDSEEMNALNPIIINITNPDMVQLNIYDEQERLRIIDNPEEGDFSKQTSVFEQSMIIFDDIEGCENPKLIKTIYDNLINPALMLGRHFNISVVICKHQVCDYSKTRTLLLESEYITVFPRTTPRNVLKHLLSYYVGLRPDQISDIMRSKSRAVTVHNRFPVSIITQDAYEYLTE